MKFLLFAVACLFATSAFADKMQEPSAPIYLPYHGKNPTGDGSGEGARGDRSKAGRFTNYSGTKGCDGGEKDESAGGKEKPSDHTWEKAGKDKGAWAMLAVDPNLWGRLKGCTGTINGHRVKVWDKCGACRGKGLSRIDLSRDCGKGNRLPSDEIAPGEIQWDEGCHLDKKGYDKPSIDSKNKCKDGKASKDCQAAPDVADAAPADGAQGAKPAPKGDEGAPAPSGGTPAEKSDGSGSATAPPAAAPAQKPPVAQKPAAPECLPDSSPTDSASKCCSRAALKDWKSGMLVCGAVATD